VFSPSQRLLLWLSLHYFEVPQFQQWQEFITLFNPNSTSATATITCLFQSSRPVLLVTHTVNARSRFTVNVNQACLCALKTLSRILGHRSTIC
jgi:hypothetical protein